MSTQISFITYNEKSDINVYQSEQRVDKLPHKQNNNIVLNVETIIALN